MTSSSDNEAELGRERRRKLKRHPSRLLLGSQVFIKKGVPRLDLQDPYYFAVSLDWRRFFLLFIVAELTINVVFAVLYALQPGSIANAGTSAFRSAFFFSLETLATVGYGEMYPATTYCHVISSIEIITGVVFTAMMTGLLFVRFSKPKAKVYYATNPVVAQHNGTPTLMLRIGNGRNSLVHDACFTLHVLTRTVSTEGTRHGAIVELPLVRSRVPIFAILYTLMHVIDETSPLHGLAGDGSELLDMRFFFTLVARDPAIGQEVSDVHIFGGADIRYGARYADAVQAIGSRKVIADYALISEIVPDTASAPIGAEAERMLTVGG